MANSVTSTLGDFVTGPRNLSTTERAIYMAVGLGIAATAVKPRPNPLLNVLALVGGSFIAWSGYNGHCAVKAALADESGVHQRLGRGAA
jgi:threonine/homoserine/homoserine lactone efflux protein